MAEKIIVAKVFVINPSGLILTMRRSKTDTRRPLTWDLPGGGVEYGEDPKDAVIRETYEEVGIKLETADIFYVSSTNEKTYVIRLLFYARTTSKDVKLSFEHDQFKWVTKDEFTKLELPDYQKDATKGLPD